MCPRNKYAPSNCAYMPNIRFIWKMDTHTYATYEVNAINHVTMGTVHIFDMLLNKYACHIAHLCSNSLLL